MRHSTVVSCLSVVLVRSPRCDGLSGGYHLAVMSYRHVRRSSPRATLIDFYAQRLLTGRFPVSSRMLRGFGPFAFTNVLIVVKRTLWRQWHNRKRSGALL